LEKAGKETDNELDREGGIKEKHFWLTVATKENFSEGGTERVQTSSSSGLREKLGP